jgi:outer membrane receptor protein involved in Fe transport
LLIYDRIGGVRQPVEIDTYNFPIKDPYNRERVYSAYGTDSWRIGGRLTANLGLRLDRYRVYVDEQTKQQGPFGNAGTFPAVEVITSNALAPRVGLAYSLGSKTVLQGTYGLFNHAFTEDLAGSFNPNTRITNTYRWRDQDRNAD